MLLRKIIAGVIAPVLLVACVNAKPPSQVIYRYDENRYLELIGYDCEGALWYHDTARNIHYEIFDGVFAPYRLFTQTYIHPSERYIVVPGWNPGAYTISKDYGRTWQPIGYSTGSPPFEKDVDGHNIDRPLGEDVMNVTIVNDQGFIMTRQGHLYTTSWPFDDPRTQPGGPGIDYEYYDVDESALVKTHLSSRAPGYAWGLTFVTKFNNNLENLTFTHKAEYQNLPDKIPDIKNYKGWTKMQCDMNAGITK